MRPFWKRSREPSEAARALEQAEQDLAATRAETPKYRALGVKFIRFQEVNHLGQDATRVLRGEK